MWLLKSKKCKELEKQLADEKQRLDELNEKIHKELDRVFEEHRQSAQRVVKTIVDNHFRIDIVDEKAKPERRI